MVLKSGGNVGEINCWLSMKKMGVSRGFYRSFEGGFSKVGVSLSQQTRKDHPF